MSFVFQDPRAYQILFLSLFLFLGIGTRDWTLQPEIVATAIVTALVTQWLLAWIWARRTEEQAVNTAAPVNSLPSALITSLGLSLLLRTDHISTMMLASAAAIASKFLFRIRDKHLFNPGNFGIVMALLLTQDAWVSPGQWGEESWYALLFLATGGLVLQRVGRWDTSVTFLGSYALLEALRNLWLGWSWDVWAHRLTSGSLMLFALFMITDPRTIPDARIGRLLWAVAIALLTFLLRNLIFLPTAAFWALFILAPLSPFLDWIWQAPRFNWQPPELANPGS